MLDPDPDRRGVRMAVLGLLFIFGVLLTLMSVLEWLQT